MLPLRCPTSLRQSGTRWHIVDRMTKTSTTSSYLVVLVTCLAPVSGQTPAARAGKSNLYIRKDETAHTINVYRDDGKDPILTQNAIPDIRPYLHPIVTPDGKGLL